MTLTACLPDVPDRTIIHAGRAYVFTAGYTSAWPSGGHAAGDISFVGHDLQNRLPFYGLAVAHDHVRPSSRDLGGGRLVECPADGGPRGCEAVVMVDGVRWSLTFSGDGMPASDLNVVGYDRALRMAASMIRNAARQGASMPAIEVARLENGIVHGCALGPC